jgi:DNA-binding NarL/FixJ family response regulator
MKRILIVADHSFVAHGIRVALSQMVGFQLVGFADGRRSVRLRLTELQPDVILVDDMERGADALERLREAAELAPDAKRLLLTPRMDDAWLDQSFESGADAVVSKTLHPVALGTLLRETLHGNVVHRYRRATVIAADCPLTSREIEILRLAAQGHTNVRIAGELCITEQTVKFHLSNTYRKLGVANRTEASHYAYVNDLVAPHERLAS